MASPLTLELLTPSYARDFALCRELVRSVERYGPEGVRHTIVVPPADRDLFAVLGSATVEVRTTRDLLPGQFKKVPRANVWLNVRAPAVPVRGWIAQQIVKLAAAAQSRSDAVLIVDSDLEFVRPFDVDTYLADGELPLYRLDDAVDARLPRHMIWDDVAHRLVGSEPNPGDQRPDYICWPCLWDPAVVRALLERVEAVTHTDWATAVSRQIHFSEMVLYGVYADGSGRPGRASVTSDMHCLNFSDETPLDDDALQTFLTRLRPDDVAVMVSAKSGTQIDARRAAIARAVQRP